MKRGTNGRRRRGPLGLLLATLLIGATALAGCSDAEKAAGAPGSAPTTSSAGSEPSGSSTSPATVAPVALVTVTPANGTAKVRLDQPVTVKVSQGTLTSVSLSNPSGATITGALSADKLTWTSTRPLAAGTSYTVSAQAVAADGKPAAASSSSFRTLTPKGTVSASIQPGDGWTVGVGMPVIVEFSRSVSTKNRPAVEKALTVSTAASVEGGWRWFSSRQVQWRPKNYWPANTKVKVTADLNGVEVQSGIWGKTRKRTADFTVGSSVISTVDVTGHSLTMRQNGKVLRTIPVTTGRAGMATRNGIKVIMSRETEHRMVSSTVGINKGEPGYYDILTHYAMRLTYSGEFLHAAPWSTGSQGRANVSHGCTGMSMADARWLFNHSKVGDVVVYQHSARRLEWGNGYTAWDMSYANWTKG